jgi:hypothetical protein
VERIFLHTRALHRRVQKADIERGVVAHQDGASATIVPDRLAYRLKDFLQGVLLVQGQPERVEGSILLKLSAEASSFAPGNGLT